MNTSIWEPKFTFKNFNFIQNYSGYFLIKWKGAAFYPIGLLAEIDYFN